MAPRNNRGKQKGEKKKKKKEEKLRPVVVDITVNLPDDAQVTLKGVSTDKIIDVRRLLGMNTVTCAITCYTLSHEIRGPRLNDTVDVAALKPCILTLVQEHYDADGAEAHVRRLLDVVACTAFFGPAADVAGGRRRRHPKAGEDVAGGGDVRGDKSSSAPAPAVTDAALDEEGETSGSRPRLGRFYEFFSLAHLTAPVQYVRKSDGKNVGADRLENHFFTLEVKLCNGKRVVVEACREGFYAVGKRRIFDHNLVDLLRQCSRAFENAYGELMRAFYKRNKFGNLPYGYRANTWLVPPSGAHLPSVFPPLPTEDEAWGGHGGGLGRDGKYDLIPWAREFSFLASMPCKTVEERLIRDRRAFLAHSLYVDMAIFRAVSAIRHVIERSKLNLSSGKDDIVHFERVGDLNVTVMRDALNASCKVNTKVDGTRTLEMESKNVLERNILKGITADENSVVHDFATLGIVNVRYCGHIALVKVQASKENGTSLACENSIMHNHTEGGANALNINSLRMLLHEKNSLDLRKPVPTQSKLEEEELKAALIFSKKVLKESLVQLINEDRVDEESLRWELGACWIQHLQDQLTIEKDKKEILQDQLTIEKDKKEIGVGTRAKTELTVEGLGKPLKILKNTHKNSTLSNQDTDLVEAVVQKKSGTEDLEAKNELYLKELLSDSVFTRLKESETGLHCKSILELIDLAKKFYNEVALPKLVADFGSLDLSPVDGQTLTDFMHGRGVQMRSLGHVVELSIKLTHIQSLCIHEMVVRAFKHLLRAVIAASVDIRQMAITIAASLNLMLGVSETGKSDSAHCMDALVWQWLEAFLLKRYGWQLKVSHYQDIRKFAILRGLCQKIGLELAPRDFDFNCSNPFRKSDIVSLVPVHKQVCCLSADGRQFLESSKTALDKGKLEEAVDFGSKALARLVAVCGPFHRMTAGAYSLFAVVLYHTGDFDQAAIYQQKALDINERQLGLDHPDTMKSYGDLAVFYYRLQHTELALGYVKRALYLLHLTCGPSHPNTAATYINLAMMEEGLGNVSIALRYLHKALNCNKNLLGPDHVQTAASYHAIAVALSLMEAYTLSVQHEWTTLQILQAKLGPDDLRTQDAAAWLEYFESKVVEQKEAARNGTRKPDTTIASKGHQSLSDLLEFINPNRTYEERPAVALNKKKSGVKVKPKLNSVDSFLTTDPFMKDSSSMSFNEEKQVDEYLRENSFENVRDTMASEILANTIDKNANDCEFSVFNKSAGNITSEGEDGWQPVRPKSTGQVGQQVGQGKVRIEKLRSNTKGTEANIIGYEANNIPYSGRCYRFKNTTLTDGKYEDDHSMKVHYSSGYFGHTLKSMAYQVKSQPLSEMLGTVPIVDELPNPPSKPLEQIDAIEVTTVGTDSRIISGGRSPSYRDVALTSPDPQAKMQTIMPKEQHVESRWKTSANQVEGFMCNMFKLKDPVPSADRQSHSEEINSVELNEKLNTIEIGEEGFLKDIMLSSGFCGNGGYKNEDAHADSNASVPGNEDNNIVCGSGEVTLPSNQFKKGNNADSSSLSISNEIEDKFVTAETMDVNLKVDVLGSIGNEDLPGKKLSASAVPFNPSAALTRGSLSPIGSPPIDQWYSNVSLHPEFASEVSTGASTWTSAHQPFISSPISPGILHTVQLIHPPDSEPQVQSRNFSPSNCMFYPNSMSWLSTVSNVADSVSTVAWPSYYPMDHRVMPLQVDLTNRMAMDTEVDSNKTGVIFPASYGNIGTEENLKRAENFIAEIIFSDNEQDEKDLWNNSPSGLNILDTDGNTEKELQPLVLTKECSENASENLQSFKTGTASISNSIRGRRKGKKTLKVPMTSLSRPHEPQSFKLVYNKIIQGSEVPKSRAHIPSAD